MAAEAGLYGTRIYVEQGDLTQLYLADNLADAVVATGDAAACPKRRCCACCGPRARPFSAARNWSSRSRRAWTTGAIPTTARTTIPQSRDQVARAPYLTQFLAEPRYAPLPQVAVASAGACSRRSATSPSRTREEPWLNTLAAFNGYNGTLLWRREIPAGVDGPSQHADRDARPGSTSATTSPARCIDAATGELRDEIAPPADLAGGTFWKWMALGGRRALRPGRRAGAARSGHPAAATNHGWPWNPLSPGYNQPEHPWGFGRTLLAIDPQTKQILWRHQEAEPIDSRALCLSHGRILRVPLRRVPDLSRREDGQASSGARRRQNDPALFEAVGPVPESPGLAHELAHHGLPEVQRQGALLRRAAGRASWSPSRRRRPRALAASVRQLPARPARRWLYALGQMAEVGMAARSGRTWTPELSRKFDPLTGKVLAEINLGRRACTRPTGCDRRDLLPRRGRLHPARCGTTDPDWCRRCGPNATTASPSPTACFTGGRPSATAT